MKNSECVILYENGNRFELSKFDVIIARIAIASLKFTVATIISVLVMLGILL